MGLGGVVVGVDFGGSSKYLNESLKVEVEKGFM